MFAAQGLLYEPATQMGFAAFGAGGLAVIWTLIMMLSVDDHTVWSRRIGTVLWFVLCVAFAVTGILSWVT